MTSRQRRLAVAMQRRRWTGRAAAMAVRLLPRLYDLNEKGELSTKTTGRIQCAECGQQRQFHSPYGHGWVDPLDALVRHFCKLGEPQ